MINSQIVLERVSLQLDKDGNWYDNSCVNHTNVIEQFNDIIDNKCKFFKKYLLDKYKNTAYF